MGSVDVGVAAERDHDGSKLLGPSLSLQLPIFNQGQGAIARTQGLLEEKRGQLRALEVNIETGVRLGTERVQAAREMAEEYRSTLIPERESVVTHSQENVNAMLMGVFELLLAKEQEYDAYQGYLEAVRDYWLARVDLTRSVGARLPSESAVGAPVIGPEKSASEPGEEMHDMKHMDHMQQMDHMDHMDPRDPVNPMTPLAPAPDAAPTTSQEGTLP
jgi:cobalt-zinc-cadmium efflux system outer membrane protein